MNQKLNIIIIIFLTFLTFLPDVLADVKIEDRESIKIDGKRVYKMYDNQETGQTNIANTNAAILKINIDGTIYIGYCIDFGVSVSTGNTANVHDLLKYYSQVLGEEEAKSLISKIISYSSLGYGNKGKEDVKYYLATQQLIWEAINNTGFYQSDYYKERSGKRFNIVNLGWTTDKETKIDISKEINNIKEDIKKYNTTPSFCSSQSKLEIEIGKTLTYTDTNGVLSNYKVVCDDGLECKVNNNELLVKAVADAGTKKIEFIKESTESQGQIYRVGNEQGVIINKVKLDDVKCEFGVDSFQNVQTSDSPIIYILIIGFFSSILSYIIYQKKQT